MRINGYNKYKRSLTIKSNLNHTHSTKLNNSDNNNIDYNTNQTGEGDEDGDGEHASNIHMTVEFLSY